MTAIAILFLYGLKVSCSCHVDMPIGLSSTCPFLSPHSIFIPLQTCFNFPSFCVAPSLSLSLLPFSSCHVCSILRSLSYAVAPLAYTSSPSLSVFLSSFFLFTFTAPIRGLFVTRWWFTFNILLVSQPHFAPLLVTVFCRCALRFLSPRLLFRTIVLYLTAHPVPRQLAWENQSAASTSFY